MTLEQLQQLSQWVLGLAFGLALVLGWVLQRSHFCAMGAISDWLLMGHAGRAKQWALALAVATAGFAALQQFYGISPLQTLYNTPSLNWLTLVLGGLLFGVGMVLASGCGSKSLVRLGGGNLKALVVLMSMGMTGVATLRGLPAVWRIKGLDTITLPWPHGPFAGQWLSDVTGWGLAQASVWLALLVVLLLLIWVFSNRSDVDIALLTGGLGVGTATVLLWWLSGVLAWVPEHPETLESVYLTTASGRIEAMSFVAPVAYWFDALMYYSDGSKRLTFGMVLVAGVLLGSFFGAWRQGVLRLQGFTQAADLVRHLVGGALMGAGGVMAMGCTFGQGLSGLSTLSWGSLVAAAGMVMGAVLTLKWQLAHD